MLQETPNRIAIVQARIGSSRLPRKVLADIGGAPLLSRVIERVRRAQLVNKTIVATSIGPENDAIQSLCESLGVPCFRGSENDVLARFVGAAEEHDAGWIVRVNADNPFLAPEHIDALLTEAATKDLDYISYRVGDRPAMLTPVGLFAEVLSRQCLERADSRLEDKPHREHVTLGIYTAPESFDVEFLPAPEWASAVPFRMTLDTDDDLRLLRQVADDSDPGWDAKTLCDHISQRPEWVAEMRRLNEAQPK